MNTSERKRAEDIEIAALRYLGYVDERLLLGAEIEQNQGDRWNLRSALGVAGMEPDEGPSLVQRRLLELGEELTT